MSWRRQIALSLLALAAVLAVFELTDLDLWVQDRCFNFPTGRWVVNKSDRPLRWAFYIGPKVALVVAGISCAAVYALSFKAPRLRDLRRGCLLMVLSLPAVPLTVMGIKQFSNVYMPCQNQRYGGDKPYVKVLQRHPQGYQPTSRGHGWPASHASGGLALMMLYFAARRRKSKLLGLAAGLAVGWIMGIYQTINGQHYLSHTIVSMIVAWMIIVLLNRAVEALSRSHNPSLAALAGPEE
jgi:membrane-associated PAP2 superfamily phosphatase